MDWILTDEQNMIAEAARGFVSRHGDLERIRALRDTRDPLGYTTDLWSAMVEMGWPLVSVPEAHGGLGLGIRGLSLILTELGAALAPEPLLSTLLTTSTLTEAPDALRDAHLPALLDGSARAALAWQEPTRRYAREAVNTRLTRDGDSVTLSGEKHQVLDAVGAQTLLVSASDNGVTRLVCVPADADGVQISRLEQIDHRNVSRVRFDNVRVAADTVFGDPSTLERALDRGTIALCAEMLGTMGAAFQRTLAYLRERHQFGRPIGSFQSLQHRAARLFSEIELCRAAIEYAASVADTPGVPDAALAQAASIAKARTSETATEVGYEAVQMHGGIGMTDEHDIGFFLKRARVTEMAFGDASWHRDRWARLNGF